MDLWAWYLFFRSIIMKGINGETSGRLVLNVEIKKGMLMLLIYFLYLTMNNLLIKLSYADPTFNKNNFRQI